MPVNQRKVALSIIEKAVMSRVPVRNPGSDVICCYGHEKVV